MPRQLLSCVLWKGRRICEGRLSKATRVPSLLQHHSYWEDMHPFSFPILNLLLTLSAQNPGPPHGATFSQQVHQPNGGIQLPPLSRAPYCLMWNTSRWGVFSPFLSMLGQSAPPLRTGHIFSFLTDRLDFQDSESRKKYKIVLECKSESHNPGQFMPVSLYCC